MLVQIYTDGAARGNPGPAGIGVVVKRGSQTMAEISDFIGKATNNISEYMAFIRGLEEALVLGANKIECFADSELLVKQIKGEYKVKNEGLVPLYYHAKSLIKKFKTFNIEHTVRDENKHADQLANQGIDQQATKNSPLFSA
jgi:ribonuclease HI